MAIGDRIQRTRKKRGLTQKELAQKIGCAEITIRQYETGKRQPRLDQISNIANVLNVSESSLIYGDDNTTLKKKLALLEMQKKELTNKLSTLTSSTEQLKLEYMIFETQRTIQDIQQEIKDNTESFVSVNNDTIILQTQSTAEFNLLTDYRTLNIDGRKEAEKRVQELTEIPRYTEPDAEE